MVVKAAEVVPMVREFLHSVQLHHFLSHGIVAAEYEGNALSCLLEQRWSGYLQVCTRIFEEYHHISETLELI